MLDSHYLNGILTRQTLELYKYDIDLMRQHAPEMVSRKFPRSLVQQAFVLNCIRNLDTYKTMKILSAGCYEDTAYETASKLGHNVYGIDPILNMPLEELAKDPRRHGKFDIVFATSVIEHVPNDEQFLIDMLTLLKDDCVGIVTTDFKLAWKYGDPKPVEDVRIYSANELYGRILTTLWNHSAVVMSVPNWHLCQADDEDFHYGGVNYTFATLTFKKKV